jgi:hypothetical protein
MRHRLSAAKAAFSSDVNAKSVLDDQRYQHGSTINVLARPNTTPKSDKSQSHHCLSEVDDPLHNRQRAPAMQKLAWRVGLWMERGRWNPAQAQDSIEPPFFAFHDHRFSDIVLGVDRHLVSASYLPLRLPFRRWLTTPPAE